MIGLDPRSKVVMRVDEMESRFLVVVTNDWFRSEIEGCNACRRNGE